MPAGRPLELTPEVIEDVRRILPTVLYLECVADFIGIDRTSLRRWIRRGAKEAKRIARARPSNRDPKPSEAMFLEFYHVYKKALAEGEIYDAGIIKKASDGQWTAAAWRLERRFPDRWGRKDQMTIRKNDVKELTDNELEAIATGRSKGVIRKARPRR